MGLDRKTQAVVEKLTWAQRKLAEALRDAGVTGDDVTRAARKGDLNALEVNSRFEVSGLDEQVARIQEQAPELFPASQRKPVYSGVPDAS